MLTLLFTSIHFKNILYFCKNILYFCKNILYFCKNIFEPSTVKPVYKPWDSKSGRCLKVKAKVVVIHSLFL
jgi:hypothetical protein